MRLLLSESFTVWQRHNGSRLAASLSFYTLLSLTPLLLIVVSIAGLAFGRQAAQSQLLWQIQDLVGSQGANAIRPLLQGARDTTQGVLATVLGLLMFLFGASGVFVELRDALNTIWEAPEHHRPGLQMIAYLVRARLVTFGLVLSIGFLLDRIAGRECLDCGLGRVLGAALERLWKESCNWRIPWFRLS